MMWGSKHKNPDQKFRSDRGFSLIEVLVALGIIGLTVALITPRVTAGAEARSFETISSNIEHLLSETQMVTKRTGLPHSVTFDRESRSLISTYGQTIKLPDDFRITMKTAARNQEAKILFMPSGQSSGGSIVLSNRRISEVITVDWVTSHVSRQAGEG